MLMCNSTPSAVFHVSPSIRPETRHALEELAAAIAKQHGHSGPVAVGYVTSDPESEFPADYLHDTEAYDS